jgi:4-hydroxy-tetrahydrodipicolinate synthase
MFQGAFTAMVTPFASTGEALDEGRLKANIRWQIEQGIDGLVPVGTTGESPTLSLTEHHRVIELTVLSCEGRVPVIAGAGSNCTARAVQSTKDAKAVGANASLQVIPYYNKPTQEGLYRHLMTIADSVDLPMVLYNIPGRCAVGLQMQTIERLATHPNIVAIKEASGDLELVSRIAQGTDLTILSGDDALTLSIMKLGGKGVVSVTSNLVPSKMHALTDAGLRGDWIAASSVHHELAPLFEVLFIETSPIPVKTAMRLMGMDRGFLRLPLCEMNQANERKLHDVLTQIGLL